MAIMAVEALPELAGGAEVGGAAAGGGEAASGGGMLSKLKNLLPYANSLGGHGAHRNLNQTQFSNFVNSY